MTAYTPQRQHFVSRVYLRNFLAAGKKGQLVFCRDLISYDDPDLDEPTAILSIDRS